MLTFQLQDRICKLKGDMKDWRFPNKLSLDIHLGPPAIFGKSSDLSRLLLHSRPAEVLYDANTGRMRGVSKPPIEPLDVTVRSPLDLVELKGDRLHVEVSCKDAVQMESFLRTFLHSFPALLNIDFADPPVVLSIGGKIGKTAFSWEFNESAFVFRVNSLEKIEQHVVDSVSYLSLKNPRFVSACHYFYVASRLIVAGHSDWEFMPECILNMCKTLQVLFGESMDSVRSGLLNLGYEQEAIEGDFIPLMVLRSHFDVGHVQLAIPDSKQVQTLYRYLYRSEDRLRQLMRNVADQLYKGSLELEERTDLKFDKDEQRKFDRLIKTMESREIPKANQTKDGTQTA